MSAPRTPSRQAAELLARRSSAPPVIPGVRLRQAIVTAVDPADGRCSLQLSGAATVISGVRCLAHVGPLVGDTVWCAQFAKTLLVVGVQDTDSAWSTDMTGFTLAANWSTAVVQWKLQGHLASMNVMATRTTSAITQTTSGNAVNTTVFSAIPAALRPAQTQGLAGPWEDSTTARGAWGCVTPAGLVRLTAFAGSTDFATTEVCQLGNTYLRA